MCIMPKIDKPTQYQASKAPTRRGSNVNVQQRGGRGGTILTDTEVVGKKTALGQ